MNRSLSFVLVLGLCFLQACGSSSAVTSGGNGTNDAGDPDAGSQLPADDGGFQVPVATCSEEAKHIYVVDVSQNVYSFQPQGLLFTDLGKLSCQTTKVAGELDPTPFSMAVDRTPAAWVLYNNGELFKVTLPSLSCTKTSYSAGSNYENFGMGFVSNSAGSGDETLFIAGVVPPVGMTAPKSVLATLSTTSLQSEPRGMMMEGNPELTGTGDANLWGFFPGATPRVDQLDKTNGTALKSFGAPSLAGTANAWAFAFWGGDFWIFLARNQGTTAVYRMKSSDGSLITAVPDSGKEIVGAGVSTCAPVVFN